MFNIEVTRHNICKIVLQLFHVEIDHFRDHYRELAMPLMDQLIEDWGRYTESQENYQPLIETAKVFGEGLDPTIRETFARLAPCQ